MIFEHAHKFPISDISIIKKSLKIIKFIIIAHFRIVVKILIIKLGAIGDVLRTTSLLEGLKERYNAEIDWVTKKESFEILKNNRLVDNVFLLENKLKNAKYDLVISLDDDKSACKLASGLNKKKIIGAYLKNGKIAYTEDSNEWFDMSLISKFGKKRADELKRINKRSYQEIISKILGVPFTEPMLNLSEPDIKFAEEFKKKSRIKDTDLVIGINTGAGKRWEKKRWPVDYTAKLIDKLNEELNAKVILFGGPGEAERNKEIRNRLKTGVIDAGCNNSLMEFSALVNLCRILITSDSLAMHIGIALKKQVVALFGPTSAAEISIFHRGKKLTAPIECYCCYKKRCGITKDCMGLITVDEVFKAVKEAIENAC